MQRLIGTGPEPEIDLGSGPRGRLAAKIAKVHERLAAAGALESHPPPPADDPRDES